MSGKAVNVDVGLEDIMWIRGLGDEILPETPYALRSNLNLLFLPIYGE